MDGQFAINQDIKDDDQTDNLNQLSTITIIPVSMSSASVHIQLF